MSPFFSAIGSAGWRIRLFYTSRRFEDDDRVYMATDGGGAYLVDPRTGVCTGVEGTTGNTIQLAPHALKRLRLRLGERSGR